MNILVTGGAGFIGSHLADALLRAGHRVRILDALIPQVHGGGTAYIPAGAELRRGDICDRESVSSSLEDVQAVFHQAAEVGVGQSMYESERYMRANTMGTTILLDELRKRPAQVKKLVVASSMSIYGEGEYECDSCGRSTPLMRSREQLRAHAWDLACPSCSAALHPVPTSDNKRLYPNSVYAISKQDQEQLSLVMGRAYGIPTVALRYFNGYGTRQALSNPYTGLCAIFCARLLNDKPPLIFEDGEQSRDFVHVSDLVQANLKALERSDADYESINVGTGVPTTVTQAAALLAEELGKNIAAQIVNQYREGDIRHCYADISKAKRMLGYAPQVKLRDGIKDLAAWVRSQTAVDRGEEARGELAAHALVV